MNTLIISGMLLSMLGGCDSCGSRSNFMHPCVPHTSSWNDDCNGGDCGYAVSRPRCGSYNVCGSRSCGSCGDCDSCGSCSRPRACCGLLTPIAALFSRETWSCHGCGERYWGDWYSDPPDCHDPCDRCGNFVGNGGWNGWGGPAVKSSGGCRNCGGGSVTNYGSYDDGDYVSRNVRTTAPTTRTARQQPTLAPQAPTRAVR